MTTKAKGRARSRASPYVYYVEAYYPASQYPNEAKESLIIKLAKDSGGQVEGSGMGFGKRDLGFLFKSRADTNGFISKLKTRRISRSGVRDWSKY